MSLINTPETLAGVSEREQYFRRGLADIMQRLPVFSEVRGEGLLIGCQLTERLQGKAKAISLAAARQGVMVLIAGASVIRFAPALNIPFADIDEGLNRLAQALHAVVQEAG